MFTEQLLYLNASGSRLGTRLKKKKTESETKMDKLNPQHKAYSPWLSCVQRVLLGFFVGHLIFWCCIHFKINTWHRKQMTQKWIQLHKMQNICGSQSTEGWACAKVYSTHQCACSPEDWACAQVYSAHQCVCSPERLGMCSGVERSPGCMQSWGLGVCLGVELSPVGMQSWIQGQYCINWWCVYNPSTQEFRFILGSQ